MNEIIGIAATVLAIGGVILNNRKMICCFYLWLISNALSGLLHAEAGMWSLCVRDIVFFVLAIEGIFKWRRRDHRSVKFDDLIPPDHSAIDYKVLISDIKSGKTVELPPEIDVEPLKNEELFNNAIDVKF